MCPVGIGADSTGATEAFAPVLIKEPGQRSLFAPVTFRESTIILLRRLDRASTSVFGLSVTSYYVRASICPSRNASRLLGCIHIDVWVFNTFLTIYQVLKGDVKPCSLTRAFIFDLRL